MNFPRWAQHLLLLFVGAIIVMALLIGGGAILGIASWINSGSH